MQRAKLKQQGSALITALFIMTLVAIAATAMSTRLQLDIYRTRLSIASDKLDLTAQAVQIWGLGELANANRKFQVSDPSGKVLDFPAKYNAIYPAVKIKGALYDLQARLNVNNVSDHKYLISFQELLKNTAKKMEQKQREELSISLLIWLNPYQPGQDAVMKLSDYLKEKPPYYPAQQFMQNISELRLLMGVDAKLYRSLQNYITALPEITPININTASKPILMSLGMGLNESQVNELIEERGKQGISDMGKINLLLQKLNIRSEQVTIESQYFMAIAYLTSEDLNLTIYTILKRKKDKNGKIIVSLIAESINSFD
ncbi:MAG: type II secretion system minor pseudopilin GspK [Tatlockia sp.]|nr:type II secretion system minor pseudopilin GspK [Tatlockia sp.]